MSMSSVYPRRRAADRSMGFGRVKMDCPDLSEAWVGRISERKKEDSKKGEAG